MFVKQHTFDILRANKSHAYAIYELLLHLYLSRRTNEFVIVQLCVFDPQRVGHEFLLIVSRLRQSRYTKAKIFFFFFFHELHNSIDFQGFEVHSVVDCSPDDVGLTLLSIIVSK